MMVKSNEPRKHASKVLNGEKLNSVLAFIVMLTVNKFRLHVTCLTQIESALVKIRHRKNN